MKLEKKIVEVENLSDSICSWMKSQHGRRLGLITSIDGSQLATLMLDPAKSAVEFWESPLNSDSYQSLTLTVPQAHWHERVLWDMFGITPEGHPRLKHVLLHDVYPPDFFPLRRVPFFEASGKIKDREFQFLEVRGEGVYEVPVGPIHAGVTEPGHFRFSCFGETILNLELKFGYVHRGVEKRLTELPLNKLRFLIEAAASDTAVANALAHAVTVESMLAVRPSENAQYLRTLALECERLAMHIADLGGMGTDTGYLGFSQHMSRMREKVLQIAQLLSGNRFLRGFIMPGGVRKVDPSILSKVKKAARELKAELKPLISFLHENQIARERMEIASISRSLATEFGMVGVVARASGVVYDCRQSFPHATYPAFAPSVTVGLTGDVYSRAQVRTGEIFTSLDVIDAVLEDIPDGQNLVTVPDNLPADAYGAGIVEAARGELIHLIATDSSGAIVRYNINDPSHANWTAASVASRDNLISDFPLCNKSLALSYSGNDL